MIEPKEAQMRTYQYLSHMQQQLNSYIICQQHIKGIIIHVLLNDIGMIQI